MEFVGTWEGSSETSLRATAYQVVQRWRDLNPGVSFTPVPNAHHGKARSKTSTGREPSKWSPAGYLEPQQQQQRLQQQQQQQQEVEEDQQEQEQQQEGSLQQQQREAQQQQNWVLQGHHGQHNGQQQRGEGLHLGLQLSQSQLQHAEGPGIWEGSEQQQPLAQEQQEQQQQQRHRQQQQQWDRNEEQQQEEQQQQQQQSNHDRRHRQDYQEQLQLEEEKAGEVIPVCKFWINTGRCSKGSSCPYAHHAAHTLPTARRGWKQARWARSCTASQFYRNSAA